MNKELDKLNKDIALKFLMYVESEYYCNCGSWHNRDTDDYKHREDIYDEFINQYKYDGS